MAKQYIALRPFTDNAQQFLAGDLWPGVYQEGRQPGERKLPYVGWLADVLNGQASVEVKGRVYVDNTERFLAEYLIYDGDLEDVLPIVRPGKGVDNPAQLASMPGPGKSILWYEYIGLEATLQEMGMDVGTLELIAATLGSRGVLDADDVLEEPAAAEEEIAGYRLAELKGLDYDALTDLPRIGDATAKRILDAKEAE